MKKSIRKLIAVVLTVVIAVSCMNIGIFAATYPSISVGEVVTASAKVSYGRLALEFVPEETGAYAFYSMGSSDTYGYIFNSKMQILAENDDYEDLNFCVQYYMTAGEKYILRSEFLENAGEGEYSVSVKKLETPEEVIIFHGGETTGYVDNYLSLECIAEPEGAYIGNCTWESDNEDVAIIDYVYGSYCDIYLVGVGTANITVTTDTGLTDTVEIECIEIPEMKVDSPEYLSFGVVGGIRLFSFTPEEDGQYAVYTSGAEMPMVMVYDSNWEMVAMNDYMENISDVIVRAELSAGETYYVQVYSFMESPDFELFVAPCVAAEGVKIISYDQTEGYEGMYIYLDAIFSPEVAITEECTWSSSNTDVAIVESYDTSCEVLFVSPGTAEITVTTESGLSDSITVECLEIEEIKLSEEKTVDSYEGGVYKFIPEKDGTYAFVCEDNVYAIGCIADSEWTYIDVCFAESEDGFAIQGAMSAGETYFVLTAGIEAGYTYTVKVLECEKATSVGFEEGSVVYGHVGEEIQLNAIFDSTTAIREECTFTSDNEDVAYISDCYGRQCYIFLEEEGTATVTVETENGLTATCTVIVSEVEFTPLNLNEEVTVYTDKYLNAYFEYTPEEDGIYSFVSVGELDTVASLLDNYMYEEDGDDDSGEGYNFCYQMEMTAGETYRFRTSYYSAEENDSYSVVMVKAGTADSMYIDCDSVVYASVEEMINFTAEFGPLGAQTEEVHWRVSDRNVIQIYAEDTSSCTVFVVGEGTATITASTDSGFYDSVTIVVGDGGVNLGDVNDDGMVNAQDTNLLKRNLAGGYSDINSLNADVNCDGKVDAIDSNLLKRILAGSESL